MRGKRTHYTSENEIIRLRECPGCGHTSYTLEFEVDYTEDLRASISEAIKLHKQYYKEKKNA